MTIPHIIKPVNVEALLATLSAAASVDIGNGLSVSIGSGRQTKFAQMWEWLTTHKGPVPNSDYSDMIILDGFGRYSICRRSDWSEKERMFKTLDRGEGRFDKFTKHQANKVHSIILERVRNWHRFCFGKFDSYKPTPWT